MATVMIKITCQRAKSVQKGCLASGLENQDVDVALLRRIEIDAHVYEVTLLYHLWRTSNLLDIRF